MAARHGYVEDRLIDITAAGPGGSVIWRAQSPGPQPGSSWWSAIPARWLRSSTSRVLITMISTPEIVLIDETGVPFDRSTAGRLVDHPGEYRRLIERTEAVVERYCALGGPFGPAPVRGRADTPSPPPRRSDEDYKKEVEGIGR